MKARALPHLAVVSLLAAAATLNALAWDGTGHMIIGQIAYDRLNDKACAQVYGTLGEPYGAKDMTLKEAYVQQGTRTARHQLVVAGCRLAVALLNELCGK
jgi:hypothetical protein